MNTTTAKGRLSGEERRIINAVANAPGGVHVFDIQRNAGTEVFETYRIVTGLRSRGLLTSELEERYPGQLQRYWYITEPGLAAAVIQQVEANQESPSREPSTGTSASREAANAQQS